MESKRKKVFVVLLTVVSRLLGLVRSMFCAFFFGTGAQADLLNYTFGIPNQARKCLEEGTGNIAVISRTGRVDRNIVVGNLIAIHAVFLAAVLILGLPLSRLVMCFSSFAEPLAARGTWMFFLFFLFLFFYSLSSSLAGVLTAERRVVVANLLPLVQSVLSVVLLVLLHERLGVLSFPVSMLVSSIAFLVSTVLFIVAAGKGIRPVLRFDRRFVGPYMSNLAVLVLSVLVSFPYFISSARHEDATTFFSNAYLLVMLPYGFLLSYFNSFPLPRLSRLETGCREKEMGKTFFHMSFFMVLISCAFLSFGDEICIFLFSGGRYGVEDALLTSGFLILMVPGAFFLMVFSIFERLMFLDGEEKKVKVVLLCQLVFSYAMMLVSGSGMHAGALTYTLSNLCCLVSCLVVYRRWRRVLSISFSKALLAGLPELLFLSAYAGSGTNMYFVLGSKIATAAACIALYLIPLLLSLAIILVMEKNRS